jgi:light-harvesting complex 1 beta chain
VASIRVPKTLRLGLAQMKIPPEGAVAPSSCGKSGEQDMVENSDNRLGMGTYLTRQEAQEFHKLFITGFIGFTLVAVVAHFLVWGWRPWL